MPFFVPRRCWRVPLALIATAYSISFAPLSFAAAQTPPAAPSPAVPTLVQKTLPSGLHLIVQTRPGAKLVAFAVSVHAGSGNETGQNSGTAHFIEHMVFKGTPVQKPGALDAQMENLGGELTARTSRDQTLYTATVPQANWQKAVPIFADLLLRPAFREADMEAERRIIVREQAAALTEPIRTGFAQIAGETYPTSSSYRLPLMGRPDVFVQLTPGDLRAFWQTWYTPQNMTLVVVGDVPAGEAEATANALFPPSPLPTAAQAAVPPAVPVPSTPPPPPVSMPPIDAVRRTAALPLPQQPQRELTSVFMGFFIPNASAEGDVLTAQKEQANLLVLARWLARGSGGTGRLEQTLVTERQEAQDVRADYVPGKQGGLLFLSADFAPDQAPRAETNLTNALRRLREDDIIPADVEAAKQAILGEIRYENETVEEQARFLAQNDLLHPALLTAEAMASQIEPVSVKDVQNVLRLYLTPARYTLVFVGPVQAPAADVAAGAEEAPKP